MSYLNKGEYGGLIPACAGKTSLFAEYEKNSGAHPRVCGENASLYLVDGNAKGSSPRVRGKRAPAGRRRAQGRLIPACAGKTP